MQVALNEAFSRAFAHERAGRKAEARAIYADILAAIPDHPGALLKIAEHDIDARSLDAARTRLDAALASAQQQRLPVEDIWFAYARLALQSGDRNAARAACEQAIAAAPAMLPSLRLL